ncbi:MAG TPA: copper resistance protein CopC, partial [Longimicrobiales bacterium]
LGDVVVATRSQPLTMRTLRSTVLAGALCLAGAGVVFAHAILRHSEPSAGSRLSAPPRELRLTFSEPPELAITTIELLDANGAAVALGKIVKGDARTIVAPIAGTLPPGDYTIAWRTAAADGHATHGRFGFTVLPPAGAAGGAASPMVPGGEAAGAVTAPGRAPPPASHHMMPAGEEDAFDASSPAYVAVRWLLFAALVAMVGAATFRLLVLGAIRRRPRAGGGEIEPRVARRTASVGLVAAVIVVATALARLVAESYAMHGAAHAFDTDRIGMLIGSTVWGWGWLLQLGAGVLGVVAFALARRGAAGWALAALAALLAAASPALSGHAAAAPRLAALAIAADTAHVLGAAGWLGSLLALVVAGIPAVRGKSGAAAELVNAFSPTALSFAGLTVASGVFSAWLHVGSIAALGSSSYGRMLLVKLAVVALTAATGAYNWLRVRPALGSDQATQRLRRSASLELVVGLGILLVTAILVGLPTPVSE